MSSINDGTGGREKEVEGVVRMVLMLDGSDGPLGARVHVIQSGPDTENPGPSTPEKPGPP